MFSQKDEALMRTNLVTSLVLLIALPAAAQEPPAPPPAAGAQSLVLALVSELEARNPELAAARRDVDRRLARVAPAGAPPDPAVSVGYMSGFLRPPFFPSASTPDAFRQVGVSQELPYPGKLSLRRQVAATEAEAARWSYEDLRLRLVAALKTTYADYVLVDRMLAIVRRSRATMEQFRAIAEARYTVGRASQQDVLRAQLELSILAERQAALERDGVTLRAEINRLLDRRPDTLVAVVDPVITAPAAESADALLAEAAQRYPALKRDEELVARGQQALALARKERLPDFAVRVTTQKTVGDMPWMYGVDVMVSVPLFWRQKQQPMVVEAAAGLDSAERMRQATLSDIAARVAQEHAAISTSRRLMELYGDSVLPQARLALESSVAAYEVGSVDFLTVLTNFLTVQGYEIGLEAQRARYRQALARLEPLVGAQFIR